MVGEFAGREICCDASLGQPPSDLSIVVIQVAGGAIAGAFREVSGKIVVRLRSTF